MKTTIDKPTWQIADNKTLEGFYLMLNEYTLDPIFLNYGGYLKKYESINYSPKAPKDFIASIKEKESKNLYKLSGNFYEASFGLSGCEDLTEDQAKEVKKKIDKHLKTDRFKKALKENFNGIIIEQADYFNFTSGFSDNWYSYNEIGGIISISSTEEEIKNLTSMAINKEVKNPKSIRTEFAPKYIERYFRNTSEKQEFEAYFDSFKKPIGAAKWQLKRGSEKDSNIKDYKLFTFKSTGRKVKINISTYQTSFIEVDELFLIN